MALERKDVITDDALLVPLTMSSNMEVLVGTLDKVAKSADGVAKSVVKEKDSLQALKESEKQLTELSNKFASAQAGVAKETDRANKELEEQNNKSKKGKSAMRELTQELKAAESEMIKIARNLGINSKEFQTAAEKAGKLKDEINDIKDAVKNVSASNFENLANSLGDVFSRLKAGNFEGAITSAKQFAAQMKALTFKELINGAKDFAITLGTITKAFLTSPLGIMAAVVGGIAAAFAIMRARADEAFKSTTENATKTIESLQTQYDFEIKIAEIRKQQTFELERQKQKALKEAAQEAIDLTKDLTSTSTNFKNALLKGESLFVTKLDEDKKKAFDSLVKVVEDADRELVLINERETAYLKEQEEKRLKDVESALQKQLKLRLKLEHDINKFMEESRKERLKGLEKYFDKNGEFVDKELKDQKKTFDAQTKATKDHLAAIVKLAQETSTLTQADLDRIRRETIESQLEELQTFLEAANATLTTYGRLVGDIMSGITKRHLQEIETRSDALEDSYKQDVENAGDNTRAKKAIEREYAASRKALDQEVAREKHRMAVYEKSLAVLEASIKLSIAIIDAVLNPARAGGAVVAGFQLAAIIAQPIPKYKRGTRNHPGGWAIINDGNGAELVKEQGKLKLFDTDGPVMVNLSKGAEVKSAEETRALMGKDNLAVEVRGLREDLRRQPRVDVVHSAGQLLEVRTYRDGSKRIRRRMIMGS